MIRSKCLTTVVAVLLTASAGATDEVDVEFFEKRIRPVLAENCYSCHGVQRQRSGLALNTYAAILKGGARGPAVLPGEPDRSLLVQAVRQSHDQVRMPPKGKLKGEQIADLVAWVMRGAPGPKDTVARASAQPEEKYDLAQRRRHWAYQPIQQASVPAVKNAPWCTSPIDSFILARLETEVSDSSIPMHGLNPPPSTARVPEGPVDAYILLNQVVFSDDPTPPIVPNRINLQAIERARGDTPEAVAAAYQDLMLDELTRWQSGRTPNTPEGDEGVTLLNWLLQNGLLDGPTHLADLLKQYRDLEATIPQPQRAPAMADGTGEDEHVFLRGNYRTLGERVSRRPPEVIADSDPPTDVRGSGRLELAHRLVDPRNPLLARVMVNRIWQHHFGEGIVRTPDDFGRMGQTPSHPELLDYLALEFVRRGWSIKEMHRFMLRTSTYRMSGGYPEGSDARDKSRSIDPENRLLHRLPVRRLEAEAIRDSMLAVSGRLDRALHGPSVLPYLTPHMEGRGRPSPGPLDGDGRRSIYINARRNFLPPLFLAFDYPVTFSTLGRRGASFVPAQALTLMNDPFVLQQARCWGNRVPAEPGKSLEQGIDALYRSAFARPPSAIELDEARLFLRRQADRYGDKVDARAWTALCHVLLNVKEFIFVP